MASKRSTTKSQFPAKRARLEFDRARSKGRIYLGDQFDRWTDIKDRLTVSHAALAKILIDR